MSDSSTPQFGQARTSRHENLGAKFGGLLAPNTAPIEPVDVAPITDPVAVGDGAAGERTRKTPRKNASSRITQPAEKKPTLQAVPVPASVGRAVQSRADQPVAINLPVSLEGRLERYRKKSGLSNPNIIFNALEATYDRLPELVGEKTIHLGGDSGGGTTLFSRPPRAVRRDFSGELKRPLIVRITAENKQILEGLKTTVGAPNRSVMVVAALDDFLPTD